MAGVSTQHYALLAPHLTTVAAASSLVGAMMFGKIVESPRGSLSPQKALDLANIYLEAASTTEDPEIALVLCHDTEVSLSEAKKAVRRTGDHSTIERIASTYLGLGDLLKKRGFNSQAQVSYKKPKKLGGIRDTGWSSRSSRSPRTSMKSFRMSSHTGVSQVSDSPRYLSPSRDVVKIPEHIFSEKVRPPTVDFKLPEADGRLDNTRQLVACLGLLQAPRSIVDQLEPGALKWLKVTENDMGEQERLHTMSTEVIRVFKRDELKDAKAVAEVVCLAPVLTKESFHDLIREFYSEIDRSGLLTVHHLEGLAQLIQGSHSEYLDADDLVKILNLLSLRLRGTHQQSTHHMRQLTSTVSHVLDAMADTNVTNLDREKLHEPLRNYLGQLKLSPDPYLVFQAAYAYQALLCVPDNETIWQTAMRRTGKVLQGVSGLVSSVKGFDLYKFMMGLDDIQKGFGGASSVVRIVKDAYDDISALVESGHGFVESLKEGFSFERKRDWYSALRGADRLIQAGEFTTFKNLIYKVSCRLDPAFQWGVCQRLGRIVSNPSWDLDTRGDAVALLGEMYRNDETWGRHASVKQWIITILVQLSSSQGLTGIGLQSAESMLQELESNGDNTKKTLYRVSWEKGLDFYPLKAVLSEFGSPSLLDRARNIPCVEGNLRLLRTQRTQKRDNVVHIPLQAKASLQAGDYRRFPLMERVKEFLHSDQKVFLLLGDSGAGKSTFTRELEIDLWRSYSAGTGIIPLHINLPAINRPGQDMIAKQLRKYGFNEPQIREMKHHRKFIVICDGYDESQQTQNLYMSNQLNQPGGWDAQMVISCRTEYLGNDYRDRFQPGDRNQRPDLSLFQEAVIMPFSIEQVQDYIQQYVVVHQPLRQSEDYKQALELIPSLKDLMTNPFLMTLSLDVLPRMVDPGQSISVAHITRVELYDRFVEQWLERGKRRLCEKDLTPQSKAILDRLSNEGFARNGIDFMKRLAVAIYKEQGGQPVVEYSQLQDEGSWKDDFFLREDKQLLREACPLTRNGNQHQFIHRSLLEYGLARAIFEPQDRRKKAVPEQAADVSGYASSVYSFETNDDAKEGSAALEQEPDINSPLVWRSFVNDHSLLHFLEERVQQEPAFKNHLLAYVEHSKKDQKWRKAAANAMTILVRAGVQFIDEDLKGIQIPGADLSYGVFDSANLQDADLRKVSLRGIWLRQADLSGSQMAGAQFGELPFLAEEKEVWSCTYSPDGESFAVGLTNGDISIYTTSDWKKARTLKGHTCLVWRIVYSPDGRQIASVSYDRTVRVWDSETGLLQHLFIGLIDCVAYSPQGDRIASACEDGTVGIWDAITGDRCQTLRGHLAKVLCVIYSPNGNQIASSSDNTIMLWDLNTENYIHTLSDHIGKVWDIKYSPQGDHVASAGNDMTVRIWDVETGVCRHVLSGHGGVHSIAYSPKGDRLASGSMDATIRLWDVETGLCRQTLSGHSNSVLSVVYSPNGDQIASGGGDHTVRLWDVSAGASRLVSSGHTMEVNSVKCSPKRDLIASGSTDNTIRLWDVGTGACRRTLIGHTDSVFSITYSPEGDKIASGGNDETVRLWNVETGECLNILEGHTDCVQSVVYSYRGDSIASASDDTTIRLWKVKGGCVKTLQGHTDGVRCVVYSPDDSQLASSSMDSTIRIWDVETGECCRILIGHSDWVWNISYSPSQGRQLASAGYDKTVRLWDIETGECCLTLKGHTDIVLSVVYSREGDLLASGSRDKTVRLWDVASGECRATIQDLPGLIWSIAWGPLSDATFFVAASGDGSVLKWEVMNNERGIRVRLLWNATNGRLAVTGAVMRDVRGLSSLNRQLLKQRGAIGEPEPLIRVVSELKQSSDGTALDSSTSGLSVEQPVQQIGQKTGRIPMLQIDRH
ncbi:MAG: WD40-repeat-containing domain protein [Benniella sp.]|nr:MAG: WD40-repeat-containing domain protein [Benniella sp.]